MSLEFKIDPGVIHLPDNYEELLKGDPIANFVDRVNDRAARDPIWSSNYRQAIYSAFHKEAEINMMTKLSLAEKKHED